MASTLKIDLIADARGVGRGVTEAESALSKLGGFAKGAGLAAAAGLAVAGVAAGTLGAQSIAAASDVEQAYGALESIYGKNAAQVKKWAESAADSVGLAKGEYANLSALVGAQLQGMGSSSDEAASKSRELIEMGADLAATFGGSVSDAVGAVSSLLKGERDPIERYGVSIKQADVEAKKAELGLIGLTGAAAKQAEAQATLALLTDQTAAAQGAFGRESSTLAGQQERFSAQLENIKVTLGQHLLPLATEFMTWAGAMLPHVDKLADSVGAWLGPALDELGGLLSATLLPLLQGTASELGDGLLPMLATVAGFMADQWLPVLADTAVWIGEKVLPAAMDLGSWLLENLAPILGTVAGVILTDLVPAARDIFTWFAEKLLPKLQASLTPVLEGVAAVFSIVAEKIRENEPELRAFAEMVGEVVGWVADNLLPILGDLAGWGLNMVGAFLGPAIDMFSTLVGWITSAVQGIGDLLHWVGKVDLTPWDGWLPGAADLTALRPTLTGGGPAFDGAALTTASTDGAWAQFWTSSGGSSSTNGTGAYTDARTFLQVDVDGSGIVDENAVAQKIAAVLARYARRLGLPVAELLGGHQ